MLIMNVTRRWCLAALGSGVAAATDGGLSEQFRRIAEATDGVVGAAAGRLDSGGVVSLNGAERFPLASVCKVPIAMNVLALVDEGKLARNQEIEVLPQDVASGVSEIATRWPAQRRFPVYEMIRLMLTKSDNTAVETLYRIGGGGQAIAARFRQWKVEGMRVDRGERQCTLDRNGIEHYPPPSEWTESLIKTLLAQRPAEARLQATRRSLDDPRDTGTPMGTVQLLTRAFRGEVLSKQATAHLIESMKATATFPTRLKGLLPPGTIVAHKTGSSGTVERFTAASNDSGVIFLPDGGQLVVSVYLKASTQTDAARDAVIARIARAAFDYYK